MLEATTLGQLSFSITFTIVEPHNAALDRRRALKGRRTGSDDGPSIRGGQAALTRAQGAKTAPLLRPTSTAAAAQQRSATRLRRPASSATEAATEAAASSATEAAACSAAETTASTATEAATSAATETAASTATEAATGAATETAACTATEAAASPATIAATAAPSAAAACLWLCESRHRQELIGRDVDLVVRLERRCNHAVGALDREHLHIEQHVEGREVVIAMKTGVTRGVCSHLELQRPSHAPQCSRCDAPAL